MPQFDSSSFSSQLFWLAISFLPLYWVLSRSIVPKIQRIMEERFQKIEGTLAKAEALDCKIEELILERERILNEAREQAVIIVKTSIEEIENSILEKQQALEATLSKRVQDSEALLIREIKELQGELPVLGQQVTQKVLDTIVPFIQSKDLVMKIVEDLAARSKRAA